MKVDLCGQQANVGTIFTQRKVLCYRHKAASPICAWCAWLPLLQKHVAQSYWSLLVSYAGGRRLPLNFSVGNLKTQVEFRVIACHEPPFVTGTQGPMLLDLVPRMYSSPQPRPSGTGLLITFKDTTSLNHKKSRDIQPSSPPGLPNRATSQSGNTQIREATPPITISLVPRPS